MAIYGEVGPILSENAGHCPWIFSRVYWLNVIGDGSHGSHEQELG